MAQVIRKLALDRRTFLRGAGACVALPALDAMQPALAPGRQAPLRSVFVFAPNGKKMDDWIPAVDASESALPFLLEPLAELRRHVRVLSGLAIDAGRSHGDGPGDHARAAASFLTCAHPRKTGGTDIHVGISVDQLLASKIGKHTVFPSLELGMERGRAAGKCDSGYACAYSNHVSWRTARVPVAKEVRPRAAFTRLFGDPDDRRRSRRLGRVLDSVMEDAKSLGMRLGAADRAKLDGYLESLRRLETRLEKRAVRRSAVAVPPDVAKRLRENRFLDRLRLMYELIALALRADLTRTVTFMLGNAGSNRSYEFLGVPDGHHHLSHHRGDQAKLAKIRKINRFHVEEFARFLQQLVAVDEGGDATLLDRSLVVYGSGLGDGNRHDHMNLPFVLAGGGSGVAKRATHRRFAKNTPAANLYLAILRAHGLDVESFADSTAALEI